MPRILLIPEFDKFGGTRSYFKYILDFYASKNYDVSVALPKHRIDKEIKSIIESYGFRYSFIPERKTYLRNLWFRFPASILFDIYAIFPLLLKENPDIVVTSVGTPCIFAGLFCLPIRSLYILHTYPANEGKIPLKSIFLNFCLNKRKLLLTVSDFSKKAILDLWDIRNKSRFVRFIHNTVKEPAALEKKDEAINKKNYRVLTLGHVTWYGLWIKVAQKVTEKLKDMDIEFIWAGDGDLLDECKKLVIKTGINAIKFTGYQQNADQLYASATIYFQPSLLESHGMAVVEAMSLGLPCVVSDSGGLPESVIDGQTGYIVNVNDAEEISSKLVYLLKNPDIAGKMGADGRKHYIEKFSYPVWERKMIQIHNELLQN